MTINKKALGVGQVFIFIIAALTFSLIMIFGYRAITEFLQRGESIQFYQFKTDLENSVKKIYTEYGSVRTTQFHTPGMYKQVCFVDLAAEYNEELCAFDAVACDVWADAQQRGGYAAADENVFLKPSAPVKIKVYSISTERGFLCLPIVEGTFTLMLEGRGDRTQISST